MSSFDENGSEHKKKKHKSTNSYQVQLYSDKERRQVLTAIKLKLSTRIKNTFLQVDAKLNCTPIIIDDKI